MGNVGWVSRLNKQSKHLESAQINLETPARIDQVILVPVIWRDTDKGYQPDGFPLEYKVIAGPQDNATGVTIAEGLSDSSLAQRVAPLVLSFEAIECHRQ